MTADLSLWKNTDKDLSTYEYMWGNGILHFRRQGTYPLIQLLRDIENFAKSPFKDYKAEIGSLFKIHIFEDEIMCYGFYALKTSEEGSVLDWYRLFNHIEDAQDHAVIRGIDTKPWPVSFYKAPPTDLEQRLRRSVR